MPELGRLITEYMTYRQARGRQPNPKTKRLLTQFVASLPTNRSDARLFTQAEALAWATRPSAAKASWHNLRLIVVRQFAIYLDAVGLPVEIPAKRLLPGSNQRPRPYIFTATEIEELISACDAAFRPVRAATMTILIGLLAVTGMRIGETLAINIGDINMDEASLKIRHTKFDRERIVCLHQSTCDAIIRYLELPQRRCFGTGDDRPLLTTFTGTRVGIGTVRNAHKILLDHTGITTGEGFRPRLHDLRHTFATQTMVDAYRHGADPAATLTELAIWLGHSSPTFTYWYLKAVPELAAIAVRLLEPESTDQ